jgi:hypothetical protein
MMLSAMNNTLASPAGAAALTVSHVAPHGIADRLDVYAEAVRPVISLCLLLHMIPRVIIGEIRAHSKRAPTRQGWHAPQYRSSLRDSGRSRTDVEVEAMAMAPIPTPEILWRKPPVLALAALPGTALGHLGEPSIASAAAWAAAGAAVGTLHDAPLPPWPGRSPGELASRLGGECEWLVASDVLPAGLVTRNRQPPRQVSRLPGQSSVVVSVSRTAQGPEGTGLWPPVSLR